MTATLEPHLHYHVEDHYTPTQIQRNFRLGVINGVLYLFGSSLFDPTLVLVAFLSNLTNSALLLGLVVPILQAGWSLPQLWVSGYVQNEPLKIKIYRRATWIRIFSLGILAATINLVQDQQVLLIVFFSAFIISSLASGLGGLPFMEVVSKTIPSRRRGELFAWRLGLGGLFSVVASFLVRWLLSPASAFTFPRNYGILGILYFIFASVALLFYNRVDEKPDLELQPRRAMSAQIKIGFQIFKQESNYRQFVYFQILMIFSGVAVPFFAVFVQREMGGSITWVGVYLIISMVSNLLVNIFYGRVSRRLSNQFVLKIGTICGVIMAVWVLLVALLARPLGISAQLVSLFLVPAFILNSFRQNGIGVSANSLLLSMTPPASRAVMLGFTQTLMGVVLIVSGFVGIIVDLWGFAVLVLVTLLANGVALFLIRSIQEGEE